MIIFLFDFDGVLADTLDDALQFGREACAQLGFERHPTPADLDALETMSVQEYGRQLKLPLQEIEKFTTLYLQMFDQKSSAPRLFPGMERVIIEAARNSQIAIVTANTTSIVEAFLKENELRLYVNLVIGVEQRGSKAEKIQIALRELGRTDEDAYMIGDSVSDIRAAKEASVKSIAAGWGHQSPAHLKTAHPDYMSHSPQELFDLLKTLIISVNHES